MLSEILCQRSLLYSTYRTDTDNREITCQHLVCLDTRENNGEPGGENSVRYYRMSSKPDVKDEDLYKILTTTCQLPNLTQEHQQHENLYTFTFVHQRTDISEQLLEFHLLKAIIQKAVIQRTLTWIYLILKWWWHKWISHVRRCSVSKCNHHHHLKNSDFTILSVIILNFNSTVIFKIIQLARQ